MPRAIGMLIPKHTTLLLRQLLKVARLLSPVRADKDRCCALKEVTYTKPYPTSCFDIAFSGAIYEGMLIASKATTPKDC